MARVFQPDDDPHLGRGAAGTVTRDTWPVAIKRIPIQPGPLNGANEIRMMGLYTRHPNVISLIDHYEEDGHYHLALTYVGRTNLFAFVNAWGPLHRGQATTIATGILNGLHHLHSFGVVHRDIKCENIVLTDTDNPVICDLGFGAQWSRTEFLTQNCGSPPYAAPEIHMNHRYYGPEVDVWSFGVVVYAMVTGHLPWEETPEQIELMIQGRYWGRDVFDAIMIEFLDHVLEPNPIARWTIGEILNSRWIRAGQGADFAGDDDSSSGDSGGSPPPSVSSMTTTTQSTAGRPSRWFGFNRTPVPRGRTLRRSRSRRNLNETPPETNQRLVLDQHTVTTTQPNPPLVLDRPNVATTQTTPTHEVTDAEMGRMLGMLRDENPPPNVRRLGLFTRFFRRRITGARPGLFTFRPDDLDRFESV